MVIQDCDSSSGKADKKTLDACQRAVRLVRSSVVRDLVSKYKEKNKMERN